MDCLLAFLTSEVVELLTTFVNNTITTTRSQDQLDCKRHFLPVTSDEVWLWIAQRLDISINVKLNIDAAYKSVQLEAPFFSQSDVLSRIRPIDPAGFQNIDSTLLMVEWLVR